MESQDKKDIIAAIREGFRQAGSNNRRLSRASGTSGSEKSKSSDLIDKIKKNVPILGENAAGFVASLNGISEGAEGLVINIDRSTKSMLALNNMVKNLQATSVATRNSFSKFGTDIESVFKNLDGSVANTTKEMIGFGEKTFLSAEAGRDAVERLSTTFGGFFGLNQTGQVQLAQTSMLMESVGFSADQVSAVFDKATRSFGMNADKTAALGGTLANLRVQYKMSAEEISTNFIQAQDKLVYSSDKVLGIFKQLQLTSRVTGIDFNALTDAFGESFDTFEGAANKAGGLNALLGDNIFNSVDLLGKNEAERMETIVTGLKDNVNVNTLVSDKFQLKAVAKQLGLSPDQTRRLLLGESGVQKMLDEKLEIKDPAKIEVKNAQQAINQLSTAFTDSLPALIRFQRAMANSMRAFDVAGRGFTEVFMKIAPGLEENSLGSFKSVANKRGLGAAINAYLNLKGTNKSLDNLTVEDVSAAAAGRPVIPKGSESLPTVDAFGNAASNMGSKGRDKELLLGAIQLGGVLSKTVAPLLLTLAGLGLGGTEGAAKVKALIDTVKLSKSPKMQTEDAFQEDSTGKIKESPSPVINETDAQTATMVRLAPGTVFEFTGFNSVTGKLFATVASQ